MVRFYSSIHSDDEMLIRQMSCDSPFHGSPHQLAAAHRTKTECLGSIPDHTKRSLIRVGNSLFLAHHHVRRKLQKMPLRYVVLLTFLRVAKFLECKPDR